MSCMPRSAFLRRTLLLSALLVTGIASAQTPQEELLMNLFKGVVTGRAAEASPQEELLREVVAGTDCKRTRNTGTVCEYRVGQNLRFSIKDTGGNNEVVIFSHSDWDDDYYAVMHAGCIVIVPGAANQKNFANQDGIFVSPRNGRASRSLRECQNGTASGVTQYSR
ncbi:MAG: hypothetical protein U1C96_08835 [Gallionella sp.]|nr:hypothetical protein [Gallionella sp.]